VGFELLKQLSTLLIRSTQGQPAFQVFGLALILLVWINYFSRIVLYAAAWAWSAPAARALRDASTPAADEVEGPPTPLNRPQPEPAHSSRTKVFAAGAVAGAAATAVAVLKARGGEDR
jgi:membrane protein